MPRSKQTAEREGETIGLGKFPSTFADGGPLPKVLIFDLDYTLWPLWIDVHVSPPLKAKANNTKIQDRTGDTFSFYSDVPSILHSAYTLPIALALASRTHAPDLANKALKLLHIRSPAAEDSSDVEPSTMAPIRAWDFFKYKEIFPGDKKTHMRNIQKDSGVGFESMLFFDDESRNRNVESLGVTFWLVEDGISIREIDNGVREWRKMKGR